MRAPSFVRGTPGKNSGTHCTEEWLGHMAGIDINIIFINCNWVITRWQWLYYMYTNMEKKSN